MEERMGRRIEVIVHLPEPAAASLTSATEEIQCQEAEKIGLNLQEQRVISKSKVRLNVHFRVDHAVDQLLPESKVTVIDPDGNEGEKEYWVPTPFSVRRN